jgi:hypothetical protein
MTYVGPDARLPVYWIGLYPLGQRRRKGTFDYANYRI